MKGLYKYLSPFAPDQSGAVSVLFELGGIIIVCDAGGCTGNICGFDEPRWQSYKSAVFSAALRDMDAILGRDDRLLEKIADALKTVSAKFIALVGTPVPAVIGTDFRALRHIAEKRFGLPVVTVDTTGMDTYGTGQEKAYAAILETFVCLSGTADHVRLSGNTETTPAAGVRDREPFAGVWGATPLDLAAPDSASLLRERLSRGGLRTVTYAMDSTPGDIENCASARKNYVVSPSGLKPAKLLEERFGIPYTVVPPVPCVPAAAPEYTAVRNASFAAGGSRADGPVLVIHQQFMANAVRDLIRTAGFSGRIDAATFFTFDSAYACSGDRFLSEEDDFISLIREGGYRTVVADPLFRRALSGFTGTFVPLPHFAVSGQLYAVPDEYSFLAPLYRTFPGAAQ